MLGNISRHYESSFDKSIATEPKLRNYMKTEANAVFKRDKLIENGDIKYIFTHFSGQISIINSLEKTCNCFKFVDIAICKHMFVDECIKDHMKLSGLSIFPNKLLTLRRKKDNYI